MRIQASRLKPYDANAINVVLSEIRQHGPVFRGFVIFLITAPLLFIFLYHKLPTVVLFLCGVLFLISLSPLYSVQGSWLAGVLSGAFVASVISGMWCYYAHVFPLDALSQGRSYSNVFPTQQGIAFADAVLLKFTDGTVVDDQRALGMQSVEGGGHTYCVAPITNGDAAGRVNFWAVGVDCCSRTSDFVCDDAGEPSTHHGFVIGDPDDGEDFLFKYVGKYLVPPSARRDMFLKAIAMAEAVHGTASNGDAILVHWDGRTKEQLIAREWLWVGAGLFISLLTACASSALLTHIAHGHGIRWLVKQVISGAMPIAVEKLRSPARHNRTPTEVRLLGFTLPVLSLVLCVTVFSFAPCFIWGNVVRGIFLTMLGVTIATILMKPRIFEYGVLLLAVSVVGSAIGRWNFGQNAFHFCAIYSHKAYSNVPADASSLRYQDAGKIFFAGGAGISVDQSVGFIYDGVVHCAAPIVALPSAVTAAVASPTALFAKSRRQGRLAADERYLAASPAAAPAAPASPEFMDFWAVGRGCCDARGGFKCFPDGDLTAGAGIVLRDSAEHGLMDDVRKGFLLAVQASADTYSLPVPNNPMLVEWGRDLNAMKRKWLQHAISIILLVSAAGFVVFAITSFVRPVTGGRPYDARQQVGNAEPPEPGAAAGSGVKRPVAYR